jgi:hypothetical protein
VDEEDENVDDALTLVRQLADDTLVAVVEMLRVLELLYLVNAEVEVPALDVVLIELRQLDETTELALDAIGRPLRVLLGDTPRLSYSPYPGDRLWFLLKAGVSCSLTRRPRFQVSETGMGLFRICDGGGALRALMRLVTLLAVVERGSGGEPSSDVDGDASSTGDTRPVKDEPELLPKLSFHFDGFFVTGGGDGS